MPQHRRITQQDLAETLGVSQSRVSQIERQGIDDTVLSTLPAYVEALGASILVLADFGEEQFVLRRVTAPTQSATRRPGKTGHKVRSSYFDGQEFPRAEIVGRWFTTSPWFSVVVGLPEMRGRSASSQAWLKLVSI